MPEHTNNTKGEIKHSSHGEHTHSLYDVIVKSDLINVIILVAAFIYLANKFLPSYLDQRKKQIGTELENAKAMRLKAEEELEKIKGKTRNLTKEAEEIKIDARRSGETIKRQMEEDTKVELENLREKVKKEINSSYSQAIQEIKKSASDTVIKLAETTLKQAVKDEEVQKKLVSGFLKELETPSKN